MVYKKYMKYINIVNTDQVAIVDDEDYEVISQHKWYLKDGYAFTSHHIKGKSRKDKDRNFNKYLHHLILPAKPGLCVDHIDRNRLNNQRSNLRHATPAQSAHNTKTSRSLPKGVRKYGGNYLVYCKKYYIGSFLTEEEAALAYNIAAKKLLSDTAYMNPVSIEQDMCLRHIHYTPAPIGTSKHKYISYLRSKLGRPKPWRFIYNKKTIKYFATEAEAVSFRDDYLNGKNS